MTIGEKREHPVEQVPGPCEYDPQKADLLTKERVSSALISKTTKTIKRDNSHSP